MRKETVNPMREDNAVCFMMFACFGIASADDNVIAASIDRAYKDATGLVLSFKKKKDKDSAKEKAKIKIDTAINQLQNCQVTYDEWHEQLCKELMAIYQGYEYNHGYEFTYGIATKLVDLTMKYLYVIYYFCQVLGCTYTRFQREYEQMICRYVSDFHVPIDRAIIFAAKHDFDVFADFTNWNKINSYEDYYRFQKAIKEQNGFDHDINNAIRYSPIDWAAPAWIDYSIRK